MTEAAPRFRDLTLAGFIEQLASPAPVPGGGAASAVAGAFAAALVRMVVALSLGKPKYAPFEATLRRVDEAAARAMARLLTLADEDAASYATLAAAFKMPHTSPAEEDARRSAIEAGARASALSPLEVLRECWDVLNAAEAVAGRSNLNARSDVGTAANLAEAACRGAAANVLINLPMTGDEAFIEEAANEVIPLLEQVDDVVTRARFESSQTELRDPEE